MRLNDAIEAFPLLLRDGSDGLLLRIEAQGSRPEDAWLVAAARALAWKRLQPGSFSNTLAPVNKFLVQSETLARQELERARLLGLPSDQPEHLIRAISGSFDLSRHEVARMRQNSMLGSVAKFAPRGIRRPRRVALPGDNPQVDSRYLDFPIDYLLRVVDAATSWRDKALWLLLAASGIRSSEAKNLLLDDLDFDSQRVFVVDPSKRRFSLPLVLKDDPRFKGRTMALTYLFPPLRQHFFHALRKYLEHEYVPSFQPGQPQFVFQYVEPCRRGQALVNCSDTALNKPFKAAVEKVNVPLPNGKRAWTLHSLRHLYGVYMYNDYPKDPTRGRYGLDIVDVQMLMGHVDVKTTTHYARRKHERLMVKLQQSDEVMLGLNDVERALLPSAVLERLGGEGSD